MTLGEARLERTEVRLILLMTVLAWVFSRRVFIQTMQMLEPWQVLALWYCLMAVFVHYLLRGIGIRVGTFQIKSWGLSQTLGTLAMIFGFFLTWNWAESAWSSLALGGSGELPIIILGTEDGALFAFWWSYLKANVTFPFWIWANAADMAADLTYPVGAFLCFLLAAVMLSPRMIKRMLKRQTPEL